MFYFSATKLMLTLHPDKGTHIFQIHCEATIKTACLSKPGGRVSTGASLCNSHLYPGKTREEETILISELFTLGRWVI